MRLGNPSFARAGRALCALGLVSAFYGCTRTEAPTDAPERIASSVEPLAWTAAQTDMTSKRCRHAAAPLGSGRVLVCGGGVNAVGTSTATCDVYTHGAGDTGRFDAAAPLPSARRLFTLTPTGANTAVAIGGMLTNATLFSDVLRFTWAPPSGGFVALSSLQQERRSHQTVALSGGQLLVTGGVSGPQALSNVADERWNGTSWQNAAGPNTQRHDHTATLLASGQVLVVGGTRFTGAETVLSDSQLYDPNTNTWSAPAAVPGARRNHSATLLPNGDVLIVGGRIVEGDPYLTSVLRYRPSTRAWLDAAPLREARAFHAAVLFHDKVVVTGGNRPTAAAISGVEVYHPDENRWSDLDALATERFEHTLTNIDADHLLVAGGCADNGDAIATGEILTAFELGESCNAALNECLSGFCVDGNCCESACDDLCHVCEAGACIPISGAPRGGRPACAGGGLCRDGACTNACDGDDDCQDSYFCDAGTCSLKRGLGVTCTEARQCAVPAGQESAHCIDGRCCNRDCAQCEACNVPSTLGTCAAISGPPREAREPCPGTGLCAAVCTIGAGRCVFPEEGTACSEDLCVDNVQTHVGVCDGAGTCGDRATPCNGFVCAEDGKVCLDVCDGSEDCADGFFCEGEICVPTHDDGADCTTADQCRSGHCIDDVCCEEECAAGLSCATEQPGVCLRPTGATCGEDAECGSGVCADGVCCAGPCSGICEACNTDGNEGQCVNVVGPPPRDPSACGGPSRCEGAELLPASECNGEGECSSPTPGSCFPYRCVATDGVASCPEACSTDAECADDYTCRNGECAAGGFCEDDGFTFRAPNGMSSSCHPYRCEPDGCRTTCRGVQDCAEGHSCDRANGTCVVIEQTSEADEGCSCGVPGRSPRSGFGGSVLALSLLLALRRSRSKPTPRAPRQP